MKSNDITCQRAVALPMNSNRGENYLPEPISKQIQDKENEKEINITSSPIYIIALTIGSLIVMIVMCGLYWKLRAEYAALSKEKMLSGGTSMIQMWNKYGSSPFPTALTLPSLFSDSLKSKAQRPTKVPGSSLSSGNIAPKIDPMSSRNLLNENREASFEDEEFGL